MQFIKGYFSLGHCGGVHATSSTWQCRRNTVPESPGDLGEGGEDPQAHHYDLRRGHILAYHATAFS
jgi:hypothetical protein